MNRITNAHLKAVVDRINRATKSPMEPWTKRSDGINQAQIGNYHLSEAYGGVSLHRMVSEGGGVSDVLGTGHVTKRDLANRMQAFLRGLESQAMQAIAD